MQSIQNVTASFARNSIGTVWKMIKNGPVAVTKPEKMIAYVVAPEDFECTQRKPRTLGFATDLIGDFDLDEFNSVIPEQMGFGEYVP